MISELRINIFDAEVDALANPVNCVGVLGAGLALQFAQKFPESCTVYKKECAAGNVYPGYPLYTPATLFEPAIIHFPTKMHWKTPSVLKWIPEGLEYIKDLHKKWQLTSIAIPKLGCGFGGLSWERVRPEIYRIFGEYEDLEVVICIK